MHKVGAVLCLEHSYVSNASSLHDHSPERFPPQTEDSDQADLSFDCEGFVVLSRADAFLEVF